MGLKGHLFQRTTNKVLEILGSSDEIPRQLPSEEGIAAQLEVSRSTVRKVILHLADLGIVSVDGRKRMLVRLPKKQDYFELDPDALVPKNEVAEKLLLEKLSRRELKPDMYFSELELAREFGCSTVTIREVLLKISRFNLIEKRPRRKWRVIRFSESMIEELIEMRELIELFAVRRILSFPSTDPVTKELERLLKQHIAYAEHKGARIDRFPDLDKRLHGTLLGACNNRYIDSFHTMSSFLIYYQIRPAELGRRRVRIAVHEHIDLLNALLERDSKRALRAVKRHMRSAKTFLKVAAGMDDLDEGTGTGD